MKRRLKFWQDDGTIESDPPWAWPEHLGYLPILDDDLLWDEYSKAYDRWMELRTLVISSCRPPEPLTTEERNKYLESSSEGTADDT